MVLCQRKLGPVKKDEVEDEISMKNQFQESGRKVMGSHKLGNASFHRVEKNIVATNNPHLYQGTITRCS